MLAWRTTWVSAASKAVAVASRHPHSPLRTQLPVRCLSSHLPAGPSADIQKAIVKDARLLQQQDKSIPWYRLVAKYHLSIDVLQNIFNQEKVDARQRQQQSELVTRAAEQHFDGALCQCNWEAVAGELDLPLIKCLDLFDASKSTIQPRSLIETHGGWSKMDMDKLRRFIATNYADSLAVDWRLAGAYMSVDALECQRVAQGTFNNPLNDVGYRRICEFRETKMSWRDIHQHFLQYANDALLLGRYQFFKAKLEGQTGSRFAVKWTPVERERTKDLIKQYLESTTRSELVDIIKRELPDKPLRDIHIFSRTYIHIIKAGRLCLDQMARLRELVAEYGEDWDRIGKALGELPSRAQRNWVESGGGDVSSYFVLSADETRQFRRLIDSGVRAKEAAKLLGTRSYWACKDKTRTAKFSGKYVEVTAAVNC